MISESLGTTNVVIDTAISFLVSCFADKDSFVTVTSASCMARMSSDSCDGLSLFRNCLGSFAIDDAAEDTPSFITQHDVLR